MAKSTKKELHPASEIKMLAFLFIKATRNDIGRKLKAQGLDVNPLGFAVLNIVRRKERTLSELSKEIMLAPATLVPVIQTLEEKRFIERGSDARDRRRSPLRLTRHGEKLLAKISSVDDKDIVVQKLKQLGERDVGELRRILRKLVGAIVGEKKLKGLLESHSFNNVK